MIIEQTEDHWELEVVADMDFLQFNGGAIEIDKQQARQLIEVLQKWIDGEEVE